MLVLVLLIFAVVVVCNVVVADNFLDETFCLFVCLVVVVVCVFFVPDLIGSDVFVTFVFLSVVVLFVFCLLLSHFFSFIFLFVPVFLFPLADLISACVPLPPRRFNFCLWSPSPSPD